ncbi:glycoside hydrolase family 2 TIM barrel-domain containing protein [Nocardioides sp. NPDC101246]|uniref:glycoside hydrolase family 2 TIM barrel-domain containing protein n=1 Tax=Nocardioides sp. NPDC101246 TaxID=3364336 RepID=UPI003822C2D3
MIEHDDVRTAATGRTDFNRGWSYRTRTTAFQELGGGSGAEWVDVPLPHDALVTEERRADVPRGDTTAYFPGGAFEYRTTYTAPSDLAGKRVSLEFDGVYRDAQVFVGGALAGQHANGYAPFEVRIDPFLEWGADNEIRLECRAHLDSRWYSGAGIHRDVRLVVKEQSHIAYRGVRITTPDVDDDLATVEVEVTVVNDGPVTKTLTLDVRIDAPDGTPVAAGSSPVTLLPNESATVRQRRYVQEPRRWSVDDPHLYTARLTLVDGEEVLDAETEPFGIRTLRLDPVRGLRINDESVTLRGACLHHDNGPLGAAAIGRAEERRVELLKQAGFNAIRSAHNPMSEAMLAACDRLGMLVMDETFDMWTQGKSDDDYAFDFTGWWERDVEAMVLRDRNHPSVILYSIGNEIPETGTRFGARLGRRIAEKVRTLDPTRYVTNGINGFVSVLDEIIPAMRARREESAADGGGVNAMMAGFGAMMDHVQTSEMVTTRTAESYDVLDVAGMNYGEARYEPDRETFPDRIIVGTETWPTVIDRNWALVSEHPHVLGDFTWTGWDYLGETGIGITKYADDPEAGIASFSTGYPGLTAWCGDLDITGHRRTVSYYRETVFGLRDEPYLAVFRPEHHGKEIALATPWSWSDTVSSWSWPDFEGSPIRVEVYSDADDVELLLDGEPVGREKVGESRAFRADFELTYAAGELTAIAYRNGQESGRTSLRSAAADDLRLTLVVEHDRVAADTADLAYVQISLTDADGTVHTAMDREVTVSVAGPGVLQGLGSAAPVTDEPFSGPTRRTFDGRALAVVRPTAPGDITISVSAPGCDDVSATVHAG